MSIRPVVHRFPSSQDLWEETNLPLCIVVTPCEDVQQEPEQQQKQIASSSDPTTKAAKGGGGGGDDDDDDDEAGVIIDSGVAEPLSSIPKCLNCGAPHPPSSVGLTHFRPARSSVLFCFLCGKTSSTLFTDQEKARRLDEYLNVDTFDRFSSDGGEGGRRRRGNNNTTTSARSRRSGYGDSAGGGGRSLTTTTSKTADCVDFRLPLEVFHHSAPEDDDSHGGGDGGYTSSSNKKPPTITWQLPAMTCPPVWWVVIDGTVSGTQQASHYYNTVSTVLQEALQDAPSHVHIGLVTATSSKIGSWDLTSAIPHIQQYPYTYEAIGGSGGDVSITTPKKGGNKNNTKNDTSPITSSTTMDLCIVPVGGFKSNIQAALRAMSDAATSGAFIYDDDDGSSTKGGDVDDKDNKKNKKKKPKKKKNDTNKKASKTSGVPLSLTLESLLEFMSVGQHPGQDEVLEIELDDDEDDGINGMALSGRNVLSELDQTRYAGGRILCLLGNPPMEIDIPNDDSMAHVGQEPFYDGGVAGVCFAQDSPDRWSTKPPERNPDSVKKKSNKKTKGDKNSESDPTDLTPENMKDYVVPLDPENLFSTIGKKCAQAAFGVDLLVIVPEEPETDPYSPVTTRTTTTSMIPWYGLPLLRVLADTSGAPGPLMFGSGDPDAIQRIGENVMARTPWQAGMVFGAKLRLRTSPGFDLEDSPVEEKHRTKLQLATSLSSGGIMGPAFVSDDPLADGGFGSPDDSGLWVLGTCDPYTSLTMDLQPAKKIEDRYTVDGFGEVAMKPVIQTCLLYTCIETDDDDPEKFYTVCKMRVSSISVPLADTVERILDYLDPEALAAVLSHKIALDAYLDGLVPAQETAEAWLRSLLVCVYQSAQLEQAKIEELAESKGNSTAVEDVNPNFVAIDRLLDQEGDMEVEDVLLGQGHSKVAVVPLLVFALMQCDALRPTGGNFRPSMDARLCAVSQLSSMYLSVLAKSIAPSLSLWSLKNDEVVVESLPLSIRGILTALAELDMDVEGDDDTVLLLDSPRRMMLFPINELWDNTIATKGRKKRTSPQRKSSSPNKNKTTKKKPVVFKIGPNLEEAMRSCLDGHRTAPTGWNDLEDLLEDNNRSGGKKTEYEPVPFDVFETAMLEDKPTWDGASQDFAEWKIHVASVVQEELVKSGDLVEE